MSTVQSNPCRWPLRPPLRRTCRPCLAGSTPVDTARPPVADSERTRGLALRAAAYRLRSSAEPAFQKWKEDSQLTRLARERERRAVAGAARHPSSGRHSARLPAAPARVCAAGTARSGRPSRQLAECREGEGGAHQPRGSTLAQRGIPTARSPTRRRVEPAVDAPSEARRGAAGWPAAGANTASWLGGFVGRHALRRWRAGATRLRRTARLQQRGRDIDRIKWGERLLLNLAAEVRTTAAVVATTLTQHRCILQAALLHSAY